MRRGIIYRLASTFKISRIERISRDVDRILNIQIIRAMDMDQAWRVYLSWHDNMIHLHSDETIEIDKVSQPNNRYYPPLGETRLYSGQMYDFVNIGVPASQWCKQDINPL